MLPQIILERIFYIAWLKRFFAVSLETEEQHSNPLYGGTFDARADEYATVDVSTKRKIIAENEMAHFKKIQKA